MRCYAFPYVHRYFGPKSVNINPCTPLRTNGDSGTRTVRYFTVLTLTDGVRIYCGNTPESTRIASSAPALFILVTTNDLLTSLRADQQDLAAHDRTPWSGALHVLRLPLESMSIHSFFLLLCALKYSTLSLQA